MARPLPIMSLSPPRHVYQRFGRQPRGTLLCSCFSSLSALADIVADEVKIDRSFITDIHKRPRSQSVLHAIESLSASLGMTVIAEGVETHEELAYLQAATNIRYAQGYYFSHPLLLEEFQVGAGHPDTNRLVESARLPGNDRKQQNRSRGMAR